MRNCLLQATITLLDGFAESLRFVGEADAADEIETLADQMSPLRFGILAQADRTSHIIRERDGCAPRA